MDSPSSSNLEISISDIANCQICGKAGHGNHFGAITCRACAAFFRRFAIDNNFKPCNRKNKCDFPPKSGWFNCKPCRLRKCQTMLQLTEQFQENLSNHLHDYYVNTMGIKNYISRIASMMKINNMIQNFVYHDRVKNELMKVFDIFHVKYSHPDVFLYS